MKGRNNLNINSWLFDLDNTLYGFDTNLFDQVKENITKYISIELNLDIQDSENERIRFYKKYGTSLRGLMVEHNINPQKFLEYVHNIDISFLRPNKKLDTLLKKIPQKKIVFTNGSRKHAENILQQLGIKENFPSIFSIESTGFIPKPNRIAYEKIIKNENLDPYSSIMIEDTPWNLEPAFKLGMKTVLIYRENEKIDKNYKYINYKTKSTEEFIKLFLENNL